MRKKQILKFNVLVAVLILVIAGSLGFSSLKKAKKNVHNINRVTEPLAYTVSLESSDVEETPMQPPFLGKSFNGFKEALAFKESRGDYFTVNSLGYMGKYQFGASTLRTIGVHSKSDFLNDPELQERAFIANLERNKWVLRRDIEWYVGRTFNGVKVTESGILAAAHLAGPGNVKRYLRTHGASGFADANGASIRYYMRKFSGYDVSHVEANKAAKI
ncbi:MULTISPECIES: peptidoglycan-binding protein LysM [Galbibacter]|uniref:Peptidoglycan-binding protein LysM n=1 Tax=Galbibacter pacificus TaxID=2996052 RepID=A0ABT6FPF4_9FLAO|nr:peptidoglycan-binding protein LysM [Galbibacter pacificus]MDG3582373.1 peptidoglycan-binding protein LysM [Galbibacter pacificus]MDG3585151.1 peptidoglycan-binding protein LysM [Galbibacter pacificus]